jgi:acyl-CoA thioesterase
MEDGKTPPSYVEEISSKIKLSPFPELIGIKIDRLQENYCRLKLLLDEKCINYNGGIHGGVIATMSDTCMGIALRTVGLKPLTAELTVNYLNPPPVGDEITAEGWISHRGNTIIHTECIVKSSDNIDIAKGRGIFVSRSSGRHTGDKK